MTSHGRPCPAIRGLPRCVPTGGIRAVCPFGVKSCPEGPEIRLALSPQKPTFDDYFGMSVSCQEQKAAYSLCFGQILTFSGASLRRPNKLRNSEVRGSWPARRVYDGVCGDLIIPSIKSVRRGGRYVGTKEVSDERAWIEFGQPADVAAKIAAHNRPYRELAAECGVEFHGPLTRSDGGQLAEIAGLVDAGKIKPIVTHVFGLSQLAEAYDVMAAGRTLSLIHI